MWHAQAGGAARRGAVPEVQRGAGARPSRRAASVARQRWATPGQAGSRRRYERMETDVDHDEDRELWRLEGASADDQDTLTPASLEVVEVGLVDYLQIYVDLLLK